MPSPFTTLDEALAAIDKLAIRTDHGTYVKVEDLRRVLASKENENTNPLPQPKTVEQARAAVRADEEIMQHFKRPAFTEGRSVPATEPQSPSRALSEG